MKMEVFDSNEIKKGGSEMEITFGSSLKRKIVACLDEQAKTGAEKVSVPGRPGLSIMTVALAEEAETRGAQKIYSLESRDGTEMFLVQE